MKMRNVSQSLVLGPLYQWQLEH